MPEGLIQASTLAINSVGNTDETLFFEFTLDNSNLVSGTNIIAVELHQSNVTSSDISFDFQATKVDHKG